jgi:hypothetical protein
MLCRAAQYSITYEHGFGGREPVAIVPEAVFSEGYIACNPSCKAHPSLPASNDLLHDVGDGTTLVREILLP